MPLKVFSQRNFTSYFLQEKYTFRGKNVQFVFLSPLWGRLGATYAVYLRLVGNGKLVVDFLLVIIELFSLGLKAVAVTQQIVNLFSKLNDFNTDNHKHV